MTTRNDIHSPKNLDPKDYTFIGWVYLGSSEELADFYADNDGFEAWDYVNDDTHQHVGPHGLGQCDHCGSYYSYGAVFEHANGGYIAVGHDCAAGRFQTSSRFEYELAFLRRRVAGSREARRKSAKVADFLDAHEGLDEAFEWASEVNELDHDLAERIEKGVTWDGEWTDEALSLNHERKALGRLVGWGVQTVLDIRGSLYRWCELSDKQVALVLRLHSEGAEKMKGAKAEAERVEAMEPVKAGRYEVTASIVSVKTYEGDYGLSYKMLVDLDGQHRAFGTLPRSIHDDWWQPLEDLKGRTVTFTAKFDPKPGANDFATFSRPTKATLHEGG